MGQQNKAWILAVNMGYGHQRTAYPLLGLSTNAIINANTYEGIPTKDKLIWETSRKFYEAISNIKRIPLIGKFAFYLFDRYQRILGYYPKRDLSKPSANLKSVISLIRNGWGENLIKTLSANPLPLISTFFTPAFMAEEFNYPGSIYCVVCDADIARPWVDLEPEKTKIKYFAPCNWVEDRLKMYGVKDENIFLTGYPLPKENVGENMEIVKKDLSYRLLNLDPKMQYYKTYHPVIEDYVGELPGQPDHPLTIMFSIGGAGAQKEICRKILRSLKKKIRNNEIKVIFSAGTRKNVHDFIIENIKKEKLGDQLNKNIEIIFKEKITDYFDEFNHKLRKTDVLWTKPSELSFYSGLGLPIIIAPSIGSQEDFNRRWLLHIGSAVLQDNPRYTDEWFFDLINSGRLAEAAMQGFAEIEKMGTYNIEKIISGNK